MPTGGGGSDAEKWIGIAFTIVVVAYVVSTLTSSPSVSVVPGEPMYSVLNAIKNIEIVIIIALLIGTGLTIPKFRSQF